MVSQRKEFCISLLLIIAVPVLLAAHYIFFLNHFQNDSIGSRTPEEYNAYLARTHHFDSVILGSSMSMNFRCSDFDPVCSGYTYKLTVPGCSVPEWTAMAEYICRHQKIKAVLADIHTVKLLVPADMNAIDEYFRDKNLLTNIRDGASLKTFKVRRKFLLRLFKRDPAREKPFSRDDLYTWSKDYHCGKIYFARYIIRKGIKPDENRDISCVQRNLAPLAAFIRRHPEIRFYLYFPPYSVLAYDNRELFLHARKTAMDLLLPLPNTELYDFQAADFITDFENYKDLTHYSQKISSWIIRQIKEKNYLVTMKNRPEFEKRFAEKVFSFDRQKAIADLKEYDSRENAR